MKPAVTIVEVSTAEELEAVRRLFRIYQEQLFDKCQLPDDEWQSLPGAYAPPGGGLLLATASGQAAGCVALRPFPTRVTCEMKRLFVAPECRGSGAGRALVDAVIQLARDRGYAFMRLDTHPASMGAAVRLYREFGFRDVAADPMVPVEGLSYMELVL
jgi:ribosomal protein S18 acetylase RimI-like enzyme